MNITVPSGAQSIISRLAEHGKRADIVGGCVRDALLGRAASDFDVTTNATPDEVLAIFSDMRVVKTGIEHGTVTVIADGEPYEVTTYRIDGEYRDQRHPDSVTFTDRIEDDLSRRDFTVNAMAYSDRYGLTDAFGGQEDLNNRIIRAVGDPYLRFSEDALRILRAVRFASVLGFEIEEQTSTAARALAASLSGVSVERIYTEWHKLLGGEGAYEIIEGYPEIISVFLPEPDLSRLPGKDSFMSVGTSARFLALFATGCEKDASERFYLAAKRLRTDRKTRENGKAALENYKVKIETDKDILRLLSRLGEEVAELTVELRSALGLSSADTVMKLRALASSGAPYRVSDLAIGGDDLSALGLSGKKIGSTLLHLLDLVIDGALPNDHDSLIEYIKKNT